MAGEQEGKTMEDKNQKWLGRIHPRTPRVYRQLTHPLRRSVFDDRTSLLRRDDIETPTDNYFCLPSVFSNLNLSEHEGDINWNQRSYQGGSFNGFGSVLNSPVFHNDHCDNGIWNFLPGERNSLSYSTSRFRDSCSLNTGVDILDTFGSIGYRDGHIVPFRYENATHDSAPWDRFESFNPPPTLSKNAGNNFGDWRRKLVDMSKDYHGCKIVQNMLEGLTRDQVDLFFNELIDHVNDLIVDTCGNFVIQKLVEVCREEQRTAILLRITEEEFQLADICLNVHGTRAVQKLLSHITTEKQVSLVMSCLNPSTITLSKDINGHHVIQHCVKNFSEEDNKFLFANILENSFSIAKDKSGCCVLQQCVDYTKGELRDKFVGEITARAFQLSQDRYGNYVVQHIIGLKDERITANVLSQLQGRFVALSFDKYGSNVVEKCMSDANEKQSSDIIMELISSPNAHLILQDPFGNYVMQSALSVSKGRTSDLLLKLVQMNFHFLRSSMYGKKVLAWFDRRHQHHM